MVHHENRVVPAGMMRHGKGGVWRGCHGKGGVRGKGACFALRTSVLVGNLVRKSATTSASGLAKVVSRERRLTRSSSRSVGMRAHDNMVAVVAVGTVAMGAVVALSEMVVDAFGDV